MTNRNYYTESDDRCSFREATTEETVEAVKLENERHMLISQIEAATKRLEEISRHPSKVFYDEPGLPYDVRVYVATGKTELI